MHKYNITYATSDCLLDDAIRVVSNYKVGSWASVDNKNSTETFVIKTSDDECIVHDRIKFGVNEAGFYMRFNHIYYKWDDFWRQMIDIYNLNPDLYIIVDEDELY